MRSGHLTSPRGPDKTYSLIVPRQAIQNGKLDLELNIASPVSPKGLADQSIPAGSGSGSIGCALTPSEWPIRLRRQIIVPKAPLADSRGGFRWRGFSDSHGVGDSRHAISGQIARTIRRRGFGRSPVDRRTPTKSRRLLSLAAGGIQMQGVTSAMDRNPVALFAALRSGVTTGRGDRA